MAEGIDQLRGRRADAEAVGSSPAARDRREYREASSRRPEPPYGVVLDPHLLRATRTWADLGPREALRPAAAAGRAGFPPVPGDSKGGRYREDPRIKTGEGIPGGQRFEGLDVGGSRP